MELKDFIKNTLSQIASGVVEAEKEISTLGGSVNPIGGYFAQDQLGGRRWSFKDGIVEIVEFDVALTSSEKEGTAGGIGVFLGGVHLGTKGTSGEEQVSSSRIKFSIPILLPSGKKLIEK